MLSFDKKIVLLFDFILPESKLWLVSRLCELAQIDSVAGHCDINDVAPDHDIDDCYLLSLIGLLTPVSKLWMAGKLIELAQIKNGNDIIDVFEVASKEAIAFCLH